jgi:O-antigen biosynthesis protein WbqP
MKRLFDVLLAGLLLVLLSPLMVAIALVVKASSSGPVLYWSDRVGRGNRLFRMPKFRSMRTETPELATHLLTNAEHWITPIGKLLRHTSLDELPQFWSIFTGHMSFVGPRPALFNQHDLVEMRTVAGVDRLTPGLTGWAQINGRDELELAEKVRLDAEYLSRQSFLWDLQILAVTFLKVFRREGIRQADQPRPEIDEPSPRRAA